MIPTWEIGLGSVRWATLSAAQRATLRFMQGIVIGLVIMLGGCGMGSESGRPAAHGSRIAIALEDVAQAPQTRDGRPRVRINSLIAAPDGSHRLFVNDMAGAIYILRDGSLEREPFFNMAVARKSQFTSSDLFEQGLNTFAFPDFARPGQPGRQAVHLQYRAAGQRHPYFSKPGFIAGRSS